MASRNWLFTINNPELQDYPEQWNTQHLKTILYQIEQGAEGTVHLQGYLEISSPRQLQWLKNLNPKAHWERRLGTRSQAILYCCKEDTRLVSPRVWTQEQDTWVDLSPENLTSSLNSVGITLTTNENGNSSTTSRLSKIREQLSNASSSIEEVADEEFELWVKYYRAFEKYVTMKTAPRNHEVEVHVLFGPTGTGKSKWAMDTYPDAYWKQRSKWWDGYFKHETVIIDEYYGWLPFDLLLRLCDRYPLLVESKGGQLQFVARTIVLTTNKSPDEWYRDCYFPSFERRVSKWHYLPRLGFHSTFHGFTEFKHIIEQA